jgi:hypothetical protein
VSNEFQFFINDWLKYFWYSSPNDCQE